jgi:hypothetical protein
MELAGKKSTKAEIRQRHSLQEETANHLDGPLNCGIINFDFLTSSSYRIVQEHWKAFQNRLCGKLTMLFFHGEVKRY